MDALFLARISALLPLDDPVRRLATRTVLEQIAPGAAVNDAAAAPIPTHMTHTNKPPLRTCHLTRAEKGPSVHSMSAPPADPGCERKITLGGRLLLQHIRASGMSIPDWCELKKLDRIQVQRVVNGERWKRVSAEFALDIRNATDGEVPVDAWRPESAQPVGAGESASDVVVPPAPETEPGPVDANKTPSDTHKTAGAADAATVAAVTAT